MNSLISQQVRIIMRPFVRFISSCVAVALLFGSVSSAVAQVQYVFQPTTGVHNWNDDMNWLGGGVFMFVPDIDAVGGAGDTALVNTAATAEIATPAPRVGELNIDDSTVVINGTGELETAVSLGSSGAIIVARPASRMEIRDTAQLTVGTVLSSVGQFHVYGPNAMIDVAGDLLMSASVLGAHITGSSHSVIMAGGSADLSGTLEVEISGATPGLGTTWTLVTATGGIDRMFNQVVVGTAPALARGLQYRAAESGNSAVLEVGNSLIVTVDRQTGATSIENAVGSGITLASYALRSAAGTLSPGSATSLNDSGVAGTGWLGSPATGQLIAEVKPNSTFTLSAGQSVSLGSALTPGVVPAEEDILFDFTTTDGRFLQGIVEYTGALNDFVLYVDPSDGAAAMGNLSRFITPPNLTGYAILSPGNQLTPGTWTSLETSGEAGTGWDASPSSPGVLAETNLDNSFAFTYGSLVELGEIFTDSGMQDLQFLYTVAGETAQRTGSVVYGAIPEPPVGTPGDYNNDGKVNAADYVLWRKNPTAFGGPGGYNVWRQNFGNPPGSGSSLGGGAVLEPTSVWFIAVGAAIFVFRRRAK
jgi:hypothetical protein